MSMKIHDSWESPLQNELEKEYFQKLTQFVNDEYQRTQVYPKASNVFRALDLCHFDQVKVVILGQDPYHGPNQANGLCFAVHDGTPLPPSLKNIFKEMETDIGAHPKTGDLLHWAEQGVLLLNSTLTVLPGEARSHQKKGWEDFTDAVIQEVSDKNENVVFMLWGSYAQKKGSIIDSEKHLILKAPHPSPLSSYRGFFGSKPFSQANEYLELHGKEPIDWICA
ncbi:MAG: uracil-DNA glycosylase [Oceanicoccus sp.]|jgi:uracil-DNA glycosylase